MNTKQNTTSILDGDRLMVLPDHGSKVKVILINSVGRRQTVDVGKNIAGVLVDGIDKACQGVGQLTNYVIIDGYTGVIRVSGYGGYGSRFINIHLKHHGADTEMIGVFTMHEAAQIRDNIQTVRGKV